MKYGACTSHKEYIYTLHGYLMSYGKCLFNLETEEAEGFRRVRVLELDHKKYVHHMFNGDIVDIIEL